MESLVSSVNLSPGEFWFRVEFVLRVRGLDYMWLAQQIGRRVVFVENRANQLKANRRERRDIMNALGLSDHDMTQPLEIFATRQTRYQDERERK